MVGIAWGEERSYASRKDSHPTAEVMSRALSQDAMETLALTTWIHDAQQMIQMRMAAGRICDEDLNYLGGLLDICQDMVEKDLGPASAVYYEERYNYIQCELAALRISFDQMMDFMRAGGGCPWARPRSS